MDRIEELGRQGVVDRQHVGYYILGVSNENLMEEDGRNHKI
jgi:hypothetical protein